MDSLQKTNLESLPTSIPDAEDKMNSWKSSSSFFGRLQVNNAMSQSVVEDDMKMGNIAFIPFGGGGIDLGKQVDAFVLAYRPFVLDTRDKDKVRSSSDVNSELYCEIEAEFEERHPRDVYSGPQYLLWVPEIEEFATILLGTKSARFKTALFEKYQRSACTLQPEFIKGRLGSWYLITPMPCATEIELPAFEIVEKAVTKFLTPADFDGSKTEPEEEGPEKKRKR